MNKNPAEESNDEINDETQIEETKAPDSLFYRLWLKTKNLKNMKKKLSVGVMSTAEAVYARKAPAGKTMIPHDVREDNNIVEKSTPEEVAAFLEEISVNDDGKDAGWLEKRTDDDDALFTLWKKWRGRGGQKDFRPMELAMSSKLATAETELVDFLDELRHAAILILSNESLESAPLPGGAALSVRLSKDAMTAWCFAFPPSDGISDIDTDTIRKAINRAGVLFGVQNDAINDLVENHRYMQIIPVAYGMQPVDGVDGSLVDCIKMESTVSTEQDLEGRIDYKSLNNIHCISKGDVILRVIPPSEMVSGIDVQGRSVHGKRGEAPQIPRIANTELSPDGLALLSSIDGRIYYEDNRFVVENLLVIDGNVDTAVGNLNFNGDILINGNVQGGFTVKTSGNVLIRGMSENATITAGGDIIVAKGVNGDGDGGGYMVADGEISAKYFENCTAISGKGISTGSIIHSNISCDGDLTVTTERGVIIGGALEVLGNVRANAIGNNSQRPTRIEVGTTPQILNRQTLLEKKLQMIQQELKAVIKDLAFLEGKSAEALNERQAEILTERRVKKPMLQIQERETIEELGEVYEAINNAKSSIIRCGTLYPAVKICIGSASLTVERMHCNCNIFSSKGEIIIGTI